MQGEILEADTSTIQLGATTSGLISDPPPSSPIFMPDALPAATLPIYPGLGQAPNVLACIPNGLDNTQWLGCRLQECWYEMLSGSGRRNVDILASLDAKN